MANFWSSWNAFSAAFCPAESPSKVKTTSPRNSFWSISSRRRILMWSSPKAVPQVAIAVLDAGEVAGHHVGVALDDDRLHLAGDVLLGEVDAVEHACDFL